MVAIFGPFSAHFQLHFWIIFGCLAEEWSEWTKNETKNDMKNGYREHPETQTSRKWSKNAFYLPLAVLGTFKLHPKRLGEIFFMSSSLEQGMFSSLLQVSKEDCISKYIFLCILLTKWTSTRDKRLWNPCHLDPGTKKTSPCWTARQWM